MKKAKEKLIYIHIGKSGGASLWQALNQSSLIAERFNNIAKVHIVQPEYEADAKYIIIVRNPIERAISAFNWRYKLVVDEQTQRTRFEGEHDILLEHRTLSNFAEALYDDNGNLCGKTDKQFRSVHHLKENIAFYLTDLLPRLSPDQIFAVFTTDTLDSDIATILNLSASYREHVHRKNTPKDQLKLTDKALSNLGKYLASEFTCVEKLLDLARITDSRRTKLLFRGWSTSS